MSKSLNICASAEHLKLYGSELEHTFYTLLFPPLCAIGIVGNCLNLTVLLSAESRTRRSNVAQRSVSVGICINLGLPLALMDSVLRYKQVNFRSSGLLVALAICDCLFLLSMVPHSLANFHSIASNFTFRLYYLSSKVHLLFVANWCSAVTIW